MTTDRIHRVHSDDGTEIAGSVRGQGPPLVLVHGSAGDGDLDWASLLPHLTGRFSCYLPSTRGRGLSSEHPDVSPERLVEDITSFVDSIGDQVALLGLSNGAALALGAAARTPAVAAVAAYEPPAPEVLGDAEARWFEHQVDAMAQAVAAGRPTDAMTAFVNSVANDDEMGAIGASRYCEITAKYAPIVLKEYQAETEPDAYSPTHPSVLAEITAPVLLLHGTRTRLRWFTDAVHHIAEHVPDTEVREITGAGHAGPLLEPAAVADELIRFLA